MPPNVTIILDLQWGINCIINTAIFHEIRMVYLMVTLIVVPIRKKEFTECVLIICKTSY